MGLVAQGGPAHPWAICQQAAGADSLAAIESVDITPNLCYPNPNIGLLPGRYSRLRAGAFLLKNGGLPLQIDDNALQLLSEQIQEQRRANELREQEIMLARRRAANTQMVLERYADLGERVSGLVISVNQLTLELHGQAELYTEVAERVERIDKALLLLAKNGNGHKRQAIEVSLGQGPEIASLKRRIMEAHRRLNKLLEQQARQGNDTPVSVLTEIEDLQVKIAEMEHELEVY